MEQGSQLEQIGKDLKELKTDFKEDVRELKTEIREIRSDVFIVKPDVAAIKAKLPHFATEGDVEKAKYGAIAGVMALFVAVGSVLKNWFTG